MAGKLQVRSVSGEPVCCFEQEKVPQFTVSQLEEHVHSVLSLSREEDVTLTHGSQILQHPESYVPWSASSKSAVVEVQCVVQAPITFNFACGKNLCSEPHSPVLIPMSRKTASRLRVGQLKGQAMKCIEQQRWTEICRLKFSGEVLADHRFLGEVLPLGESDEVTLDLDLQRQGQRVYYYVAAAPAVTGRVPMDAGRPVAVPTAPATAVHLEPAVHAERSAAAAASPEELQELLQHRLTRSFARR